MDSKTNTEKSSPYANKNSERAAKWNRENRERRREIVKRWDAAHRDSRKSYRESHKEEIAVKHRVWHSKNWDRIKGRHKEQVKRWRLEHPLETQLFRQARRLQTNGKKIDKEQIHNWESMVCGICNLLIEGKFDIDHIIPLSRGGLHEATNLQLAHPTCNTKKHNKLPSELQGALA